MHSLIVLQGVRTVQLTKGYTALVDEEDYEVVSRWKWRVCVQKWGNYAMRSEYSIGEDGVRREKGIYLHRQIMSDCHSEHIDHRDRDALNNTRENLRPATFSQNMSNRKLKVSASGFKGVQQTSKRSWYATIRVDNEDKYLGSFRSPWEAACAYDRAAIAYFGEFAITNAKIGGYS
jgi:hypothetical protein